MANSEAVHMVGEHGRATAEVRARLVLREKGRVCARGGV